ncbi:hypothetical protein Chor_000084 [Crotalus horridus]
MDIKGQYWTDDDSDGENESEEFLYGVQFMLSHDVFRSTFGLALWVNQALWFTHPTTPNVMYEPANVSGYDSVTVSSVVLQGTCAADLYRHPQLDVDIEAVKELYSENSVSVREYGTIDDVDIDLHINIGFLDVSRRARWRVSCAEGIGVGKGLPFFIFADFFPPLLEPSIEVFQPSNKEGFGLGLQLKKILGMFTSQQWKHLSNDFLKTQQEKRHSWFKAGGTIKKFRAGLSIFSPIPKSPSFPVIQDSMLKGKLGVPELRVNRLMNRSISCTMKNSKVEVFGYPPSTQAGVVPFNILVGGHCKNIPTLEYGFLVQVVDLLVAMCRAALESPRKSIIFEPYPSVVDPSDPKTLAFNPKKKNYERLQKALDSVMSIREMTQGSYLEIKKQMDKLDPLAHPLLQWIISSNRSHIVKLPLSRQLKFMHTSHQFLLLSSPPAKEARFRTAKKLYGSTFAFHGSHIENWHSILRNGLVNASYTKLQLHGAAYGKGIYLSPISSISFGYSGMGKGQHRMPSKDELVQRYNRMNTIPQTRSIQSRFLQSRNLNCIALCEVITSKDLQKHGNIWVCPVSDHVCTRFFFVYEDGQVGDANINTQDPKIQKEIMRVIGTQVYTN